MSLNYCTGQSKRNDRSLIMAKSKVGLSGQKVIETKPKKTRQGAGQHTKYAATSRNAAKKRYRGQGKA